MIKLLNTVVTAVAEPVKGWLAMPSQEEFDALVLAGWEREEERYAEWVAGLYRDESGHVAESCGTCGAEDPTGFCCYLEPVE